VVTPDACDPEAARDIGCQREVLAVGLDRGELVGGHQPGSVSLDLVVEQHAEKP
jgi:hypothetical protein